MQFDRSPFFNAVINGDYDTMMELLNRGVDPNQIDSCGFTPLHLAPTAAFVNALLDAGADPVLTSEWTPLHTLTDPDAVSLLAWLVNTPDDTGSMPLHTQSSIQFCMELIRNGADVNAQDSRGRTPLHRAYNSSKIQILLDAGANPNAQDFSGNSPLFGFGTTESITLLTEHGADLTLRNHSGDTPLQDALKSRRLDEARVIFQIFHRNNIHYSWN